MKYCKLDVRKAILDKAHEEVSQGRYTFSRVADDTIQLNNITDNPSTKIKSTEQANAVAKEVIARLEKSFNNQVSGYIIQATKFDPIHIILTVKDAYVNHEYNKLPADSRDETTLASPSEERGQILTDTGINTDGIYLFSPASAEVGVFRKFIQFKRGQLSAYQQRLNKIEVEKKKRGITTERLTQLNNLERELKLQVEGSFERGIKGIRQEIAELEKNPEISAVGYYAEKDIQRLDKLANSSNIDDLHEAQRIVDFYELAGTFTRGIENPFFTPEDIFLADEDGNLTTQYRLSEETRNQFEEWKNRANYFQNIINKRKEEATVNTVNSDSSVQRTYGADKKFTFDELIKDSTGLKDTDWISMWTMDVTQGIFSTNGVLPQVMFSYLANSFEERLAWARGIEEQINQMTPEVQRELIRLGYSLRGAGILGIRGASYQLFKEITKEGNETGGLVQRFVKEFFDAQASVINTFRDSFDKAKLHTDYNTKQRAFNKAFEELKKWRRNNTIVLDGSKIPELTSSTPENEAYKKELVDILGENGYKEQVDKQLRLLYKYQSDRQSMIDTLLVEEGKTDVADLSDDAKNSLSYWENNHNPARGIEDYNSVTGLFFGDRKSNSFMDYNVFIPRKFKTNITADAATNKYAFADTTTETGFYSGAFAQIEGNETLSKFYDVIKEVCETIRENMPYELQQKMTVNTIPALLKTSSEIIADKHTGVLSALYLGFRNMMERIRLGFGVVKQSEISFAVVDPVTGRANYKVNDQFLQGNARAVQERMTIEKGKFLQAFNSSATAVMDKILGIRRYSVISLSRFNVPSLIMLADYLHVDISLADIQAGRIDKIRAITGENVEIGKYIRDFSLHSTVQSQSFDLGKIAKYFSNMVMGYAARQEALPILEIMKSHYESIKKPKTNNLNTGIYNANDQKYEMRGLRTRANTQMDDWFERVVLDNYGTKHIGPHGSEGRNPKIVAKINIKIANIDTELSTNPSQERKDKLVAERERLVIKKTIPVFGKSIHSAEDKRKIADIDLLLSTETDEKKRADLIKIKEGLGKVRTATAILDNLFSWIRTLRLGYNLSSATTNFLEGVTSNMILGSMGEYFDPKEIFYGYNVVKHSFLKNLTFGYAETSVARKNRRLMDKFNVIMDSKNELQKSSTKSYASKLSWLGPHELNQRVEFINQSPLMIAMLRTEKIKNKDGAEDAVWNALDSNGHLKEEFRTEENIGNWEQLAGSQYLVFKQRLHKAIILGHGNYDVLRGMMIKSSSAGKALAMFKTWFPMQIYSRFAKEQDDIQSGTIGYKGRYWSYGKGSGAIHGAAVGAVTFGPLGALFGLGVGALFGGVFGTQSEVGFLKETLETTKQLLKKALGMPINLLAGRQIIGTGAKAFSDWAKEGGEFTEQDAKNLRGNMADISVQLAWLALILLTKSLFWDDDDDSNDPDRIAHNILINRLVQLSSQGTMYLKPNDNYKSIISSNAVMQYLTDVGKEVDRVIKAIKGRDIIPTGINAGESGLWNQTKKTFMPGIFKDGVSGVTDIFEGKIPSLGFESQGERVFQESPWHEEFKSKATLDSEANKRNRAERRLELKQQGLDNKTIRHTLDEEYPTPSKLKKLGVTRDEYEESQQ